MKSKTINTFIRVLIGCKPTQSNLAIYLGAGLFIIYTLGAAMIDPWQMILEPPAAAKKLF